MTAALVTSGWLFWIAYFCALEWFALKYHRGQGMTLSEHVWTWFGIQPALKIQSLRIRDLDCNEVRQFRPHFVVARHLSLALFMLWLSLHFTTGGNEFLHWFGL